jgi:mannosyltransferase OCH1-like enzyme
MGGKSSFKVQEVNSSNIKDYLDSQTIERIEYTIKNGKMNIFTQTKSDLIRLALLYKHGGIYVDASTLAI